MIFGQAWREVRQKPKCCANGDELPQQSDLALTWKNIAVRVIDHIRDEILREHDVGKPIDPILTSDSQFKNSEPRGFMRPDRKNEERRESIKIKRHGDAYPSVFVGWTV